MKRLYTLAVCLIALVVSALPASNNATINFTYNFDFAASPDLSNFWLYYGMSSSNYTSKATMGTSTNFTMAGFPRNTLLYCNCTAVSTNGVEGDFTTEFQIRTWNKPKQVTNFKASQ